MRDVPVWIMKSGRIGKRVDLGDRLLQRTRDMGFAGLSKPIGLSLIRNEREAGSCAAVPSD